MREVTIVVWMVRADGHDTWFFNQKDADAYAEKWGATVEEHRVPAKISEGAILVHQLPA